MKNQGRLLSLEDSGEMSGHDKMQGTD